MRKGGGVVVLGGGVGGEKRRGGGGERKPPPSLKAKLLLSFKRPGGYHRVGYTTDHQRSEYRSRRV